MTRGCPQGTAFGPLSWIMSQNDMAYHVNVPTLTMSADDHQLFAACKTHGTVESRLKIQGHLASSRYKINFLLIRRSSSPKPSIPGTAMQRMTIKI